MAAWSMYSANERAQNRKERARKFLPPSTNYGQPWTGEHAPYEEMANILAQLHMASPELIDQPGYIDTSPEAKLAYAREMLSEGMTGRKPWDPRRIHRAATDMGTTSQFALAPGQREWLSDPANAIPRAAVSHLAGQQIPEAFRADYQNVEELLPHYLSQWDTMRQRHPTQEAFMQALGSADELNKMVPFLNPAVIARRNELMRPMIGEWQQNWKPEMGEQLLQQALGHLNQQIVARQQAGPGATPGEIDWPFDDSMQFPSWGNPQQRAPYPFSPEQFLALRAQQRFGGGVGIDQLWDLDRRAAQLAQAKPD